MPDAHTRTHTFALLFVFAVVIVIGSVVFAGVMLWARVSEPYKGFQGAETFVEIPPGAGTAEIRRRLVDAGVVRDRYVFRAALWWSGQDRTLKAGEYRFDQPMSAVA